MLERMTRRAVALLVLAACGGGPATQPLYAAGDDKDDGHGLLARASSRLRLDDAPEPGLDDDLPRRPRRYGHDDYGGATYGGDPYGGGPYGGATYASYVPPSWSYPTINRSPTYSQKPGLEGAIEGTIRWRGDVPRVTTSCGPIEPVRVGANRGVGGVVVYIERVSVGRVLPHGTGEQRPATVGGTVVKRGCALLPPVQIVTPVPAALAIHGDARRTRIRITAPNAAAKSADLHEGGRVVVQAKPGITRIESEDATVASAWAIGLESPAFAVTADDGTFRIDELAPGSYDLTIWQPPVPTLDNGALVYAAPVLVRRTVKVGTGRAIGRIDVTLGK